MGEKWPSQDAAGPGGFFPYYRSQEESLPGPQPPRQLRASPHPSTEARIGLICRKTVQDQGHVASTSSHLLSGPWHSPACGPCPLVQASLQLSSGQHTLLAMRQALCTSGVTPYYRSPEERLNINPGPPASRPQGKPPLRREATL
ncbi:uncharacterized protein RHO17_003014 isoform 1-T2 [Thomomys bottae]